MKEKYAMDNNGRTPDKNVNAMTDEEAVKILKLYRKYDWIIYIDELYSAMGNAVTALKERDEYRQTYDKQKHIKPIRKISEDNMPCCPECGFTVEDKKGEKSYYCRHCGQAFDRSEDDSLDVPKPITDMSYSDGWFRCPGCGYIQTYYEGAHLELINRCEICGQKLDWGDR